MPKTLQKHRSRRSELGCELILGSQEFDGGSDASHDAAPFCRAASSPTSSPAGGSLLGGYESSDEAEVGDDFG